MTVHVVVPVKAPAFCKTRLAGVLDAAGRAALVARMLAHVVGVAEAVAGEGRVMLLGPERHGLPARVPLLDDPGGGLNLALAAAGRRLSSGGGRILFLSADLPWLTIADVAALAAGPSDMVLAPDRAGTGTNALALDAVDAARFPYRYGAGSLTAHREEAARAGLACRIVDSPTIAFDVDMPEDVALLMEHAPGEY